MAIPVKKYFAYDSVSDWFAPAKFDGIINMSISKYLKLMKIEHSPCNFDGWRTKKL